MTYKLMFTGQSQIITADEAETPVVCLNHFYFPQQSPSASINIYNPAELIHSHKPMTATEDWFLNSSNI